MMASERHSSLRIKPLWRIRRPGLSLLLSCLVAVALLWGSLLTPRTFQATGSWLVNTDPLLSQIKDPQLATLADNVLHLPVVDTAHVKLSPLTGPFDGLRVTATAQSADMAIDRVDEWLAQRAAILTAQMQDRLNPLHADHATAITQGQTQLAQLDQQITDARKRISDKTLPTQEDIAKQLATAQQKLEQLTRQQAVYMGANRTLKGLISRRQLLKQDLALHMQRYGRDADNPSVKLVRDQLEKLNVRIKVISEASKLDADADAKLAKVSTEIDACKQSITLLRGQQEQLVEQARAADLLGELVPRRQALFDRLTDHRTQVRLIDEALAGRIAWGQIQQASASQTRVIWPTPGHVLILAFCGMLISWLILQLVFRMSDRTLDASMRLEECVALPILGQVTFAMPRLRWSAKLCRMTVLPLVTAVMMLLLCVSLTAAYLHLQPAQQRMGIWHLLSDPGRISQFFETPRHHSLPPRAMPVVIRKLQDPALQLSDKSS